MSDTTDPSDVRTGAEFMSGLRRLKAWSGRSYREIQAQAERAGHALPYSTAAGMLKRATLPREQVVEAFARGCGLGAEQAAAWVAARKRVAMEAAPQPQPQPQAEGQARAEGQAQVQAEVRARARAVRGWAVGRWRWVAAVLVVAGLVGVAATYQAESEFVVVSDVQEIEP
ncbi:hypothetical protein [Nonomuraea endophytica]|uniref:XRE family transcriptional regulator n=1 Tax=Nonomuraea endophytica TaxID=714136 RepID=A0A7W8AFF9_9ACTN|nr:hypothetical protein [Nonomuraea endophytica]MBB5084140.1 hypothetical protein [Nonomuraea endophytica]